MPARGKNPAERTGAASGDRLAIRIGVKRIHETPGPGEGLRFLVDRLWPRGVKKEAARLDGWLKDVAPSDGLRRWFGHSPVRWEEFRRRYFAELDGKPETWRPILEVARQHAVTLLYAARDTKHNNAVALREYLVRRLKERETPAGLGRSAP